MTDDGFLASFADVAYGEADGDRWTLRAGGTPEDFYTLLVLERSTGQVQGGGCGGPRLQPDRLMETGSGSGDDGPVWVVGRVHPSVALVRVASDGHLDVDMTPVGDPADYGVRFVAALLPPGTQLTRVTAHDDGGRVVDEWAGPFAYRPLPSPLPPGSRIGSDGQTYWVPRD